MLKWFPYLAWPLVLLVFAVVLFQVKHNARRLDRDVSAVQAQIVRKKEAIRVLRAEWSHLNQPGYLAALASHHLGYDPENRTRIVTISELPMRASAKSENLPVPKKPAVKPVAGPVTGPVTGPENGLRQAGFSIPGSGVSGLGEQRRTDVPVGLRPGLKPAPPKNFRAPVRVRVPVQAPVRDGIRSPTGGDPLADLISRTLISGNPLSRNPLSRNPLSRNSGE